MENKHFDITMHLEHVPFTFSCTTIHEAYEAINAILSTFPGKCSIKRDDIVRCLVRMADGHQTGLSCHLFSVHVHDGEV